MFVLFRGIIIILFVVIVVLWLRLRLRMLSSGCIVLLFCMVLWRLFMLLIFLDCVCFV